MVGIVGRFERTVNVLTNCIKGITDETRKDLSQDLWLALLLEIERLEKTSEMERICNIDGHVFVVLSNKVKDIVKSSRYKLGISLNEKVRFGDSAEYLDLVPAPNTYLDLMDDVLDYIAEISSPMESDIIELRFFKNMTYKEIGRILNVSEDTAQRRAEKIINKVRRWVKHGN